MHSLLICLGTQFKTPSLIFKVLYSLKLWTQKIVFTHMNLPDIRCRHPASVNRNKFDGHTEQGFLSHGPLTLEFVTLSDLSCFFTSEDLLKTLLFWTALDISFSLSLCCLILCLILLLNLEFMAQLLMDLKFDMLIFQLFYCDFICFYTVASCFPRLIDLYFLYL